MAVATIQHAAQVKPFADGTDEVSQKNIDWGTATPVNHELETEIELEDDFSYVFAKRGIKRKSHRIGSEVELPRKQRAMLLHQLRQPFTLTSDHPVPEVQRPADELVVKIQAIGLNPIDWKAVDYGFGIPQLPYVSGRDFAGIVVKAQSSEGHIRVGDTILCPSTDYRDLRKAAYQEYAIATSSTVCRIPEHLPVPQGAALGVAYVAAALALGVCLGLCLPDLGSIKGPDLLQIVRDTPLGRLPQDMLSECLAMKPGDRPESGDWLAIWGGSSTSALFLSQMARMAGMKVVLVMDVAKHGSRLVDSTDCVWVDSHDPERAVQVIRGIAGDQLRFAIDTVGAQTASRLATCLTAPKEGAVDQRRPHLVGLAALPKAGIPGIVAHSVPVKLFHEVEAVGSALMAWLEKALETRSLELPRVDVAPGGLEGINKALDSMRQGLVSGRRLVVTL